MSARKNGRFWKYGAIAATAIVTVCLPIRGAMLWDISFAEEAEEDIPENTISESTTWSGSRVVTDEITVEPGVILTISKGTIIEFDQSGSIMVSGTLRVEGTVDDPVIIRKHGSEDGNRYSIVASDSGTIRIRNADISGGGKAEEIFPVKNDLPQWLSMAYAFWSYSGAVGARDGGHFDIENADFHDNVLAISVDVESSGNVKVWRSKFSGNDFDVEGGSVGHPIDARYNWWGRAEGPEFCKEVNPCDEGNINASDWAKEENFKDPIIILPGILGSWRWNEKSELELDPIFGTFDDLIKTLEKNGYDEGKNLSPFPYEWHESNAESALLLKAKVENILAERKWPRVDIVAHSMGGLVAREYIEALGGGEKVDQLVTLGTPQAGSPGSYLTWEGGDLYADSFIRREAYKMIFTQEAEENGYENIFEYVRRAPISSVKELLPTYSYLRNKDSGDMRAYPDTTPRNTFLEHLNSEALLKKLEPVSFTAIVGKLDDDTTIETIRVEDPSIEIMNDPEKVILWGHGKPDGYDDFFGDRGLELDEGDGTVPEASAKGISADEIIEIESKHGDLPSKSAKRVFHILTGRDAKVDVPSSDAKVNALLALFVFSPVDIQIVSPSGKRIGKDFSTGKVLNDIPGAYYTGFDTKNEFLTIRNPESGAYTVLAEGTDTGSYRIETTLLRENENGDGEESTVEITGETTPGERTENTVELTEAGTVIQEQHDTVPPVVNLVSPESKTYQNTRTITLAFSVSDDATALENIKQEIFLDEKLYTEKTIDASLLVLGAHAVRVRATDEAGNIGEASVNFTLETSWKSLLENIRHYRELGLFKNDRIEQEVENRIKAFLLADTFLRESGTFFEKYPIMRAVFIRNMKKQTEAFEQFIQRQSGVGIDALVTERMIGCVEFLKNQW